MRVLMCLAVLVIVMALSWTAECQCSSFRSGTPAELKSQCLDTVPYNRTAAKMITDALLINVQMNSYTQVLKRGLAPYNLKVNLKNRVSKIAATTYPSDFDFQNAIQQFIKRLNDGHVTYSIPSAYDEFVLWRPYSLKFALVGGSLQATLESCSVCSSDFCSERAITAMNQICEKLDKKVGTRVTLINGVDPVTYYSSYAQLNGAHPDLGGRFNALLQSQHEVELGLFFKVGLSATEVLTFADQTTVTSKIIASGLGSSVGKIVSSVNELAANYAEFTDFVTSPFSRRSTNQLINQKPFEVVRRMDEDIKDIGQILAEDAEFSKTTNGCSEKSTFSLGSSTASILSCTASQFSGANSRVILATVPTFSGEDEEFTAYFAAINAAMVEEGSNKLIIDVSNNGGGNIPYAGFLLITLTNAPPNTYTDYYAAKKSKLLHDYVINGKVSTEGSLMFFPNGTDVGTEAQWWQQGRSRVPSDPKSFWTKPMQFLNSNAFTTKNLYFTNVFGFDTPKFVSNPALQITALTNGLCSSTCSVFMTRFTKLSVGSNKYRVAQYGGLPNAPFDTSDIACNVLNKSPRGVMGIPFRPLLINTNQDGSNGTLRQFSRDTPTVRLNIWRNKNNLAEIYSDTIALFD